MLTPAWADASVHVDAVMSKLHSLRLDMAMMDSELSAGIW